MKLRLQWKWTASFLLLFLLFLIIQGYSFYFLHLPFLLSSLISLILLGPLAYWLARSLMHPVLEINRKATQILSSMFGREIPVHSEDELKSLSWAIHEMGIQLENKIEEISKEKEYLQTTLKGMLEGVLIVDGRGRILMANDALRNLLSLPSEVANKMPLEVILNVRLEEAIRKSLQSGENIPLELDLTSSGGKIVEVNVVGILPSSEKVGKDEEGTRGAVAVFHDITRLKELEKIRQDFVANVSHELRTPLTTIKGYAETLLEGALKEEVAPRFVQIIMRHTDRLTKIVEDLLILSKIESREFKLQLETISLRSLIDDVIDFIKKAAEKKKIAIYRDEIPSSIKIHADRSYIEQILINLLDNAVKYTPEGGQVTVSAFEKAVGGIQFAVKDNGIGIPKEDIPRIFERFYRVDKGRSQEMGGTGLGLSIVKHLVHVHGGKVWVESQMGKGSTFYFSLSTGSETTT